MLTSTKNGAPEKDRTAPVGAAEVIGRVVQHDQWARSEPTTKAGMASCIGSDMSIVGSIECNGPAQVFGRIEGEVRASDLQISEGAQVEGSVIAQQRDSLRPRKGHYPCRSRQAAKRWRGRGRHFSSVVVDR
jgi:predicted acyltransferase (DUF342 family)